MEKARGIANAFAGFSAPAGFCKVKNTKTLTVDRRVKDFLTDAEIEQFLTAARKGTHGQRDFLLALFAYRHGFRVSELINVRLEEVDLKTARLFVRRLKGSLSTLLPRLLRRLQSHPIPARIQVPFLSLKGIRP
jgi:integrase